MESSFFTEAPDVKALGLFNSTFSYQECSQEKALQNQRHCPVKGQRCKFRNLNVNEVISVRLRVIKSF